MAALNAAGYNFEVEEQNISEVRALVKGKAVKNCLPELSLNCSFNTRQQTSGLLKRLMRPTLLWPSSWRDLLDSDYREQLVNVPHGIDVDQGV